MTFGLIEKELRQHGTAFALLFGVLVSGLALLNSNHALSALAGTPLESMHLLLITIVPLAGLFLVQLLVAGEFRQKTQLFLEGLPLPRWKMLAVKYGIGWVIMMSGAGIALGISCLRSIGSDGMTPNFSLILAAKTAAWTWFAYSALFAHAFLGRYRTAFGIVLIVALAEFGKLGLPINRFCAFQLVDSRFAYERLVFPIADFTETAVAIGILTVIAFLLGLVRDATIATLLAERMSAREKMAIMFATLAGLMAFAYLSEQESAAAPVRLPGAYEIDRGAAHVVASAAVDYPLGKESEATKRVATDAAVELERLSLYLGGATLPQVFIVHRRDFAAGQLENGGLKRRQGLMVRVNLASGDFQEDKLLRWIVREVLLLKSGNRSKLEQNAWVLDGFSLWWPQSQEKPLAAFGNAPEWALAASAMPPDFSTRSLRRWLTVRDRLGEQRTDALAWSGLAVLAARHGPDACQRFLAAMLGPDVPADARGWLSEMLRPMPRRFRTSTGVSLEAFVSEWRAALREQSKGAAQ